MFLYVEGLAYIRSAAHGSGPQPCGLGPRRGLAAHIRRRALARVIASPLALARAAHCPAPALRLGVSATRTRACARTSAPPLATAAAARLARCVGLRRTSAAALALARAAATLTLAAASR